MKYKSLEELLKKKKEATYIDIKRELGLTRKKAKTKIKQLKEQGIPIDAYLDENYIPHFYIKSQEINNEPLDLRLKDGNYLFAFTGDWHVGSKYFDEISLNKFFDECNDRDVKYMFHTGDLIDGVDVYRSQQADLKIHTKMEQAEYIRDYLPILTSGDTLFITGNHDLKHLESSFDPGIIIEQKPHYKYLGQISRDIIIGGLDIRLIHLKGQAYCLDMETEILTKEGFKHFKELNKNDKILTLNKKGFMEWHKFKPLLFDFEGNLIHFKGENFDILATPNHRHLVRRHIRKKYKNVNYKWVTMTSKELKDKWVRQKFDFNRTGKWKGKNVNKIVIKAIKGSTYNTKDFIINDVESFVKFLGWYISEGHTRAPGRIFITQLNMENTNEIINLFGLIGLKANYNGKAIVTNNKRLMLWLDNECGKYAKNKKVPQFIKNLKPELIKKFLITLFKGDGSFVKNRLSKYTTISKKLADDVIELLLKIGLAGTINYRKDRKSYDISVCSKRGLTPSIQFKPKEVYYKGKVWCVQVPNETFYIKRNGKTMWTKNSRGYGIQKYLRNLNPERMPDILLRGHNHQSLFMLTQGVYCFETGTFQKGESNFVKEHGMAGNVAAWICEIDILGGKIKKIKQELLNYE